MVWNAVITPPENKSEIWWGRWVISGSLSNMEDPEDSSRASVSTTTRKSWVQELEDECMPFRPILGTVVLPPPFSVTPGFFFSLPHMSL